MTEYQIANYLRRLVLDGKRYKQDGQKFYVAAAILDKRGRIISIGQNHSSKTHPLMRFYSERLSYTSVTKMKVYLHAEVAALIRCRQTPHTMIVIRVTKNGRMAIAKPCPICQLAIKDSGLKKVYYTNDNEDLILLR